MGALWSRSLKPLPEFPLCNLDNVVICCRIVVNFEALASEAVDLRLPSGKILTIENREAVEQDGKIRMKLLFVSLVPLM